MDCNNLPFSDIDAILEELGVEPFAADELRELEAAWSEMPYEVMGNMSKLAALLAEKGEGDIDYSSFRWVPSSERVFSFDIEAEYPGDMYAMLLMGITAIGRGELVFEDVSERQGADGTIVEFTLCGREYAYETKEPGMWYDLAFLDYLNSAIAEAGFFNRLRFMSDGYQEIILFYCDEIWAQRFKYLTGYRLFSKIEK